LQSVFRKPTGIFAEELLEGWVTIYMDDILIHMPDDLNLHRKRVHQILDKLQQHDLYLKPEKCLFEQREMEFLEVVLSQGQIHMDNAKLQGIADWPTPTFAPSSASRDSSDTLSRIIPKSHAH
jgi:hypothetical protein